MAWTKTYEGDEPQRINKWLGQSGVCSRREAEGLVEQGLISIDGTTVTEPGRKIEKGETLTLADAATDKLSSALSIVLNKPIDYVSAHPNDGETPAVRLLTPANLAGRCENLPNRDSRLAPVGRLDKDSRGLLILTEDGVLTKAVIGPDAESEKEYLVTVNGKITPDKISKLCHGLRMDGRALKPAKVTHEGGQLLRFILIEGRNRQIRRMAELVQLHVVDLFRIRIGHVHIENLPEGKWRPLSSREHDGLIDKSKADTKPKPDPQIQNETTPSIKRAPSLEQRKQQLRKQGSGKNKQDQGRNAAGYSKHNRKAKSRPKYPGSK